MARRTTRLGRYHLTNRIAYGGMAEIFRGFTFDEEGYRHDVAIKKLLPDYVEDANFVAMLEDEYRLVSRLRHPNVAKVYELVQLQGHILIAMEYVDGRDLRTTVQKGHKTRFGLSYADVAYIMACAMDGLHHAHVAVDEDGTDLGVVHRDFSPSNVLLGYDGAVKICDFGIAKARRNRIETKTGVIKGKVRYMSPEQAFGHRLDRRSDVFSAGSVLYELCTGHPPFQAANEIDLIFRVREANPVPPRQRNPHLPPALARIIERSMARERSERYPSALALRDALVGFLKRHEPSYRRSRLARYMKRLWAPEIEADLRLLEDYVLDLPTGVPDDFGRNLLADAMGPDAPYARFSPRPTRITRAGSGQASAEFAPEITWGELTAGKTVVTPPRPDFDDPTEDGTGGP